jgi:hypothetical protein
MEQIENIMDIHGVSMMNDGNRMFYSLMAGNNQW